MIWQQSKRLNLKQIIDRLNAWNITIIGALRPGNWFQAPKGRNLFDMAELNLKQIIDRLNAEFTGETRKLVFWYDDKAEFSEDMETVELQNAKIYHLQPDNQFYTKYFLERVDKTTNYLIYAPFPKPDVRDNHLEDTMLYSRRFFADRASLLSVDLGIEEKYKPVIEKHIKFFANKERTQRFYDLEIENFNEENILVGLLSAVCKARTCSFEEVVRIVLTDGELVDNAFLQEFEKYFGNIVRYLYWAICAGRASGSMEELCLLQVRQYHRISR